MNEQKALLAVRYPDGTNATAVSMRSPDDGARTWVAHVPIERRRYTVVLSGLNPGDVISAWLNTIPMMVQARRVDSADFNLSASLFGEDSHVQPLSANGGVAVMMVQVDQQNGNRWIGRIVIGTGLLGHLLIRGVAPLTEELKKRPGAPQDLVAAHLERRF